jgi:hypothetical protein
MGNSVNEVEMSGGSSRVGVECGLIVRVDIFQVKHLFALENNRPYKL